MYVADCSNVRTPHRECLNKRVSFLHTKLLSFYKLHDTLSKSGGSKEMDVTTGT